MKMSLAVSSFQFRFFSILVVSTSKIPAKIVTAPTLPRFVIVSPVNQYDVSHATSGSSEKINAALVDDVYCCAHAMAVNADGGCQQTCDQNRRDARRRDSETVTGRRKPEDPHRPIIPVRPPFAIWNTASDSKPMSGE